MGWMALATATLKTVAAWFGYKADQSAAVQGAAGQKSADTTAAADAGARIETAQAQPTGPDQTKKALDDGTF